MVQVIQRKPGIAQHFSEGLKGAFIPHFEQQYQRGMIKNSMQEVKDLANNPDATSFDLASALISSTAGIPGSEKYVGQLFPLLNDQIQRQRSLRDFGPNGQPGTETTPLMEKTQEQNKKTAPKLKPGGMPEASREEMEAESTPSMPNIFQFYPPQENYNPAMAQPGQVPIVNLPYPNPDDYLKIRMKARQLGYTTDMEERLVNDAKEANQSAKEAFTFQQAQYNQNQQEGKDYLDKFNNIKQYIDQNGPEFSGGTTTIDGQRMGDPDDMQLALKVADDIMTKQGGNPQQVLAKVKETLRPYQQSVNSLDNALDRPLFGGLKGEHLRKAQDRAQQMIQMGQKDKLRLIIGKNGHGQIEEAKLINPLPEDMDKYFEKRIEKKDFFVPMQDTMSSLDPDKPDFFGGREKIQEKNAIRRQKQVDEIRDYLANNITSGTYEKPGTNILLMRKNLMDLGMEWQEAGRVIEEALKQKAAQGDFTLDSHQNNDYIKLAYAPLSSGNWFKNFMQYFLFGKE